MVLLSGSLVFWRLEGLEPRVKGLLALHSPDSPGEAQLAATAGKQLPGQVTVANQVAVLGPISEDVWLGCSALPGWRHMESIVRKEPLRPLLRRFWLKSVLFVGPWP